MSKGERSTKARANVQANRSKQFLENYDKIFGKKDKPADPPADSATDTGHDTTTKD